MWALSVSKVVFYNMFTISIVVVSSAKWQSHSYVASVSSVVLCLFSFLSEVKNVIGLSECVGVCRRVLCVRSLILCIVTIHKSLTVISDLKKKCDKHML